jgi:transmembrane sensor
MDTSPLHDIPWDLIAESLAGSLTVEEELQLQEWMTADPANGDRYAEIKKMWESGMEDYRLYQMADVNESWESLRSRLRSRQLLQKKDDEVQVQSFHKTSYLRNLIAIAAVLLGFVGIGFWIVLHRNNPVTYETAINEQKKVVLPDGTVIMLHPQTEIEVPAGYNKKDRKIIMDSGEAFFDVEHQQDKPFTVGLGTTLIRDIGTSFTITREKKKIGLHVTTGTVAFVRVATNEARVIHAGSGITFDSEHEKFGEIQMIRSSVSVEPLLDFENTPLSEVVASIQKVYGEKIILPEALANRKLTAKLDGMPYHTALDVICISLGLEYSMKDNVYILKATISEQP